MGVDMKSYIVTAIYYEEVEVEAASESEAIRKAKALFDGRFIAPHEI